MDFAVTTFWSTVSRLRAVFFSSYMYNNISHHNRINLINLIKATQDFEFRLAPKINLRKITNIFYIKEEYLFITKGDFIINHIYFIDIKFNQC